VRLENRVDSKSEPQTVAESLVGGIPEHVGVMLREPFGNELVGDVEGYRSIVEVSELDGTKPGLESVARNALFDLLEEIAPRG
jgi:hypothetical protein